MAFKQVHPNKGASNPHWKAHTSFFDRFVDGNSIHQKETGASNRANPISSAIARALRTPLAFLNRKLPFDCTKITDYKGELSGDFDGYNARIRASAKPLKGGSAFSNFFRRQKQPGWSPEAMEAARTILDPRKPEFFQNMFTQLFHLFAESEMHTISDATALVDKLRGGFPMYTLGRKYKKADFERFVREMRQEILAQPEGKQAELLAKFRMFLPVLADNCSEPVKYVHG